MEWKKTFNFGQWLIHGILVGAIGVSFLAVIYALKLHHFQGNESEQRERVASHIESMKKNVFENITHLVISNEKEKATDKMRELSQMIADIEDILELKAAQDLGQSIRTFKKVIGDSSGISDPSDALKVLGMKIRNLRDFAVMKNYPNVRAISERMLRRIDQLNPKNVAESIQATYLKSDFDQLEKLVKNSSLKDEDKRVLFSRLNTMLGEIEILNDIAHLGNEIKSHAKTASLALAGWLVDVEKKSEDLKTIRVKKQNYLTLMMASLVGYLALSWIAAAYLFRWQKLKIGNQVENEVRNVLEKGILGDQRFMMDHYSENTRDDIVRLLDDLKVKLNLGSMLHEGLPFAGCMIDASFHLTWHNGQFLEQFYLSEEEVRSDAFNWDYLREYLNLDEDPVYEAIVNKTAGIYPVKIKQDEFAKAQPYEMYVTPINVNREDRVMVFFYPLVSVSESIDEQVNLVRASVLRFTSLWDDNSLDNDQLHMLHKDFKNYDIEDIFYTLSNLFEKIKTEKNEYLETIKEMMVEADSFKMSIKNLEKIENEREKVFKEELVACNNLKDLFLSSIDRIERLVIINKKILQHNDELKSEAVKMQNSSMDQLRRGKETIDVVTQLEGSRIEYKKLKNDLLEVKARLVTINNSMWGQIAPENEAHQKLASRYRDELTRLDFNVSNLDKKLIHLDILIGKLSAMYEKSDVTQAHFNFSTSQRDHEIKQMLQEMQSHQEVDQMKIADELKSLHNLIKKNSGHSQLSKELIHDNTESTFS